MTTTHLASHAHAHAHAGSAPAVHPVVRAQTVTAGIATAAVAVMSIAIAYVFGAVGIFVLAATLPFPLIVLWRAVDVVRSDEV